MKYYFNKNQKRYSIYYEFNLIKFRTQKGPLFRLKFFFHYCLPIVFVILVFSFFFCNISLVLFISLDIKYIVQTHTHGSYMEFIGHTMTKKAKAHTDTLIHTCKYETLHVEHVCSCSLFWFYPLNENVIKII